MIMGDPFWMVMVVASLLFAVISPYWFLNIMALWLAYEYYKMAHE